MSFTHILLGGVALFVLAGLLFLALGVLSLIRRAKSAETPRPSSRGAVLRLAFGFLLIGFAGYVGWQYRAAFERYFRRSFTASPDKLQALLVANLNGPERKPAPPGEWPQWRGFHRDGLSDDANLLTSWPESGPPQVWRKDNLIKGGYSSIAVSNGRLYTMDKDNHQERVLCLDAKTGNEIWIHSYQADYAGIDYGAGPRATPTVHDGKVYTVGATGVFLCLEAMPTDNKPKILWAHDLTKEFAADVPRWGFACSPLIEGELVIVQPGGKDGSIVAFDRQTGNVAWKSLEDAAGYSSPVAATAAGVRQIVCFTANGVTGLRPTDGKQLWYYRWATDYGCNVATPIVAGEYVFISSNYQAGCALLQLSPKGDGVAVEEIFVRADELMRNHFSTCVRHGDYLYGFDVTGHGSSNAFLKCINLRTFEEKWSTTRDRHVTKGGLLYADGHLIVLSEDGWLSLVEATPEGFRKKGAVRALQGSDKAWAAPALAAGRLYLRDNEHIVCLDLNKEKQASPPGQ